MTENALQPLHGLNLQSILLILTFTVLSGLGDGAGFVYASRVWSDGRFVWIEAFKCLAAFQFGMVMYWLALWKLTQHGVASAEIQTLFWFVVTIIGVALLSGRVFSWAPLDQAVAAAVLMGVFFLMYRGASA
jgi:Na+/citrate or Na+/malate symporter